MKKYLTIKPDEITLEKIKQYYFRRNGSRYISFYGEKNGVNVIGYTSGKVLFSGDIDLVNEEASRWMATSYIVKEKLKDDYVPQVYGSYALSHYGSDEVGVGDYFGPLVVVATYVKSDIMPKLRALGVKDSKKMNDNEIICLAPKLIALIPYSCLSVTPEKYNEIIAKKLNATYIKVLMHNRALLNLKEKVEDQTSLAIIDQFVPSSSYYSYLEDEKKVVRNVFFTTKAEENYLAVAAASIIARYNFLRHLDEMKTKYNFTFPKGAGSIVDEEGKKLVEKHGREILNLTAKMHFANTLRILSD